MEAEKYFDFYPNGGIRLKGHRIDLEYVIRKYKSGMNLVELLDYFDTLNAAELEACINYYLLHQQEVDETIRRLNEEEELAYQAQQRNPRTIALKKRFEEHSKKLLTTSNLPHHEDN